MHTYFCPACGRGYEAKEATRRTSARVTYSVRCPSCDVKLQLGGGTLIVLALLFALFLGDFFWGCTPTLIYGPALFWSCIGIGVMRLVRQYRAERAQGDRDGKRMRGGDE